MRLFEFEATELFRKEGINGPDFAVANNTAEAKKKALEIGLPVVIIQDSAGTPQSKVTALRQVGAKVADSPAEIASLIQESLKEK